MAPWTEENIIWKPIFEAAGIEPDDEEYSPNPPFTRRVLCICRGGNCRSVAAAFLLKYKYNLDAIACGFEKNSHATLFTLVQWADAILVLDDRAIPHLGDFRGKRIFSLGIGTDVWANGLHPELLKVMDQLLPTFVQEIKR